MVVQSLSVSFIKLSSKLIQLLYFFQLISRTLSSIIIRIENEAYCYTADISRSISLFSNTLPAQPFVKCTRRSIASINKLCLHTHRLLDLVSHSCTCSLFFYLHRFRSLPLHRSLFFSANNPSTKLKRF